MRCLKDHSCKQTIHSTSMSTYLPFMVEGLYAPNELRKAERDHARRFDMSSTDHIVYTWPYSM